jgi:lipoyl(octanoyl) transferase
MPFDSPPSSPRDEGSSLRPGRPLLVRRLGLVPYADGLELQRRLVEDRKADRIPDTLLLLQHPHVLTVGVKKDGRAHILASSDRLTTLGVDVFETGRGGDVTYHGPGQLVGYPILDLNPDRRDVHKYVRDLEEVMIRVCADYGLDAGRVKGFSGAWIKSNSGDEKIGAIGVRISRWITSHGFAFNVTTDVDFFNLIVPCGIADKGVTSLAAKLGEAPPMSEVEDRFVTHFSAVFGRQSRDAAASTAASSATSTG